MKVQVSSGVTELQRCSHSASLCAVAASEQIVEGQRVVARPGHPDHVLELRQRVADGADLLELVVVLDDDDARVRVLEHVLALLGRVRLVDRDDGRAGAQRREVEVGPLGAGVGEDRDLVALLDPEVDQAQRQPADDVADLLVGLRDPVAARLVAVDHRAMRGVLAGGEREQVRDRLAPGGRVRRLSRRRDRSRLHQLFPPAGSSPSPQPVPGARARPEVYFRRLRGRTGRPGRSRRRWRPCSAWRSCGGW